MPDEVVNNPTPETQPASAPETPPASAPETPPAPEPAQAQPTAEAQPTANPLPNPLEGEPEAEAAQPTAPERYEDFSLGEYGTLAEADAEGFTQAAREYGLTQDKAQKIIDSMAPVMVKKLNERLQGYVDGWQKAAQADPEIGGANYQAKLGVAKIAYQRFATPELKQMLSQSGLGTNPEILRLFYRVGQTLQQDQGVRAGTAPAAQPFRKYPNTPEMYK